ncbi:MAG: hypothetical protein HOE92_00505 [Euryarchaeota archaeon]|jgi:ribosomal protein L37AE/L43A|nr:hypothetical protein [Euryarchaeota archaeon]MBT3970678.1 hypothetical protein [Euryarchaeota archaeon]MBT6645890.1 hypothetical protein [Euryarchaeota archaeon]
MGLGIRRGREEAQENLSVDEEGDCPRCRSDSQPSTIPDYLQCVKCSYEWPDPEASAKRAGPPPTHRRDAELISEFKQEMEGGHLKGVLGIDKKLNSAQEESLHRLESKWMDGMQGHFNVATEERKPLMISFDEDDNLVNTTVASLTLVANGFDGGEEIRLEYPGVGTEFYIFDEASETGWRRGRSAEDTARSIASVINRHSQLVFANLEGTTISFEMRSDEYQAASLVLFVDDPGGRDIVYEKGGVSLDPRDLTMIHDYRAALEIVLEDGIISPSEDQMLWAMRQHLGIEDHVHVHMVMSMMGENALKECPNCSEMGQLYPEYNAWYCQPCEEWL